MADEVRVLVVTCSPPKHDRIDAMFDFKKVNQRIETSRYHELLKLKLLPEPTAAELQDLLADFNPHVLHLAAHGSPDGIYLRSTDRNRGRLLEKKLLVRLFAASDSLRIVVLNSCETEAVGAALLGTVDFVISMRVEISDKAAIAFASSFYNGLALNKSVKTAAAMGRDRIEIDTLSRREVNTPVLSLRNEPDGDTPFLELVTRALDVPRSTAISLSPPPRMWPVDGYRYGVLEVGEGRELAEDDILNNPVAFENEGNRLVARVLNSRLGLQYKCYVDMPPDHPPYEELAERFADVGWERPDADGPIENRYWFRIGAPALTCESGAFLNNFVLFVPEPGGIA